jgi:glycosyltransferase involved in cell wall biosynthesis
LADDLRVLQVIHQFPPFSWQGSEVYCLELSRRLRHSCDVRVFHVSNPTRRQPRGLHTAAYQGVPSYHCVDGGAYARVAAWPNERLRRAFADVLGDARPHLVHFHNYVSLGDDLVGAAADAGAAVVYTLHDYGLICPNALLLRDDGALCGKADADFFAECCPVLVRADATERHSAPPRARLPSLARWQMFSRQQATPLAKQGLALAVNGATRLLGSPRDTHVEEKRRFFLERTRAIFERTDLFLAPSRFLMDRFVACGLPAAKIRFLRNGMRPMPLRDRTPRQGPLRVGYIGSLQPQKGLAVLIEAFRGIDGAVLHVHGSAFNSPIAESYRKKAAAAAGPAVHFHGEYANDDVADVLAGMDIVVVPSLWFENAPLTIQEAFMAGVPVITSDAGGMAELVQHGVNGLLFRLGDAADLRARIREVVANPALLERLSNSLPAVPGIDEHATDVLDIYRELVARPAAAPDKANG